jgi:glycosyltransferase involved in cell wall biosynthesis
LILTEYQAHYTIAKAGRMAGVPHIVLSFTGVAPPNTRKKRMINKLTDRMLDRIITASEIDMQKATEDAFPTAGKTICRGFGLAPDLFSLGELHPEKIRDEFSIPENAPIIGTTTRIAPGKGQDHLIRALPKVMERFPDVRVFILGGKYDPDQPYTGELMHLAEEQGVMKNLIFTGEREDTPDIFANYRLAVHLPDYDHLPFGVLECGALGIPTIATAVGGITEIISDNKTGILLPAPDPDPVAEAVISLMTDDDRRKRLGAAMRGFVLRRFDLDALVDRVNRMYNDLLAGEIKEVYD